MIEVAIAGGDGFALKRACVDMAKFNASIATTWTAMALLASAMLFGVAHHACAAPSRGHEKAVNTAPTDRRLYAPKPVSKQHAKKKTAHRKPRRHSNSDVYRWSDKELMLGGVDPVNVGGGNGK